MHRYEKREWPLRPKIGAVLIVIVGLFVFGVEEGFSILYSLNGLIVLAAFIAVAIATLFLHGCLLISLNREGLFIKEGHFPFSGRRVPLQNIQSIQRTEIPWYRSFTKKGLFTHVEQYSLASGKAFLVIVKEGKNLIVQTENREEVLAVFKNLLPNVDIS